MQIAIRGRVKALEREHGTRAWLAWQIGRLAQTPGKHYPSLETLTGKPKTPEVPMSSAEIARNMARWSRRLPIVRTYPPGMAPPVSAADQQGGQS